jgi:23S rRNA pseudouridine1911/1915/1917 synthase
MQPEILWEDNHLIIVNKAPGVLVQGDQTRDVPLSEIVKAYIKDTKQKPGEVFLGVVHRIDRPVSGLVIFARTSKALERMNEQFRNKAVQKTYWAVIAKPPEPPEGRLTHFTLKDAEKLRAKIFAKEVTHSKECILDYKVLTHSERYYLLEVKPLTGRYHQIRAQLSHIGCPIKGDVKYGYPRTNDNGSIHLHARAVDFIHPVTKLPMHVEAPVPKGDTVWEIISAMVKEGIH